MKDGPRPTKYPNIPNKSDLPLLFSLLESCMRAVWRAIWRAIWEVPQRSLNPCMVKP